MTRHEAAARRASRANARRDPYTAARADLACVFITSLAQAVAPELPARDAVKVAKLARRWCARIREVCP